MNSGGGDRQSPPLPGGEFLLRLLHNPPPPRHHPPILSNGHDLNGYPLNPNPNPRVHSSTPNLPDSFQKLGLYSGDEINGASADLNEGNRQFSRFADSFYGSPNTSGHPRGEGKGGFDGNHRDSFSSSSRESNSEANYRNSPGLVSGGRIRAVNGYQDNYFSHLHSNSGGSNKVFNGSESNYRNSPNSSGFGEGYVRPNRVLNGLEANYRNSLNSGGFGKGYDSANKALNGFENDYRNSPNPSRIREGHDRPNRALNGSEADFRNTPNLSRIGEGYNRGLNVFDSDFPKFPNYSNMSRTSAARQEVKQTPPGFANKATNMNFGRNMESSSNGSRNWGIKFEDEREISDKMIKTNQGYTQLGSPVPSTGSALNSVSGFETEESLSELHREIDENGEKIKKLDGEDKIQGGLDAHGLGSLEEEDGSSDKNQKKKRDKDYRSDTRGQRVLAQWMRKSKKMIQCRRDIDFFNVPLLGIYDSLVPPEEEKMKQKQLLALLEKLVVKEWPEARLLVYGSCANSFGVKNSDIDICLAMKDTDLNKCDILLKLADILKAENLENVQALTHARVPIVKLMDPVTGISCDICINNVLAVVNSKLLRDYAKIDDRLRQLAFIVKHWAKSRGVNETYHGTLSSYAYVLMCIHFLQQCRPAILPCLQGMDTTYNVIVENVECAFFDRVEKLAGFGLRNRENIGQLVWGFFRYWAYCHDYTHDVVSVRVGSVISKQAKDWTRRVGNDRHLICIEDPFEITHDLGRVVDKFSIKVLREEFERAAQILQFDPNPCVTLFEPYVRS